MNRWHQTAATLTSVLLLGVSTGCGNDTVDTASDADTAWKSAAARATPTSFEFYADEWGVLSGIRLATDSARRYTSGTFAALSGAKPETVSFWSERQEQISEAPVSPFPAEPGDEVLVESSAHPDCSGPVGIPVFTLTWTSSEGTTTESFAPDDLSGYRKARQKYCAQHPSIHVSGSTSHPNGDFTIHTVVFNPTDKALELDFAGIDEPGNRWDPVHASITPGAETTVTFTGRRNATDGTLDACLGPDPWQTGLVTLGGKPLGQSDGTQAEAC